MSDYIKREDAMELFEMVLDSYKNSGIQNIKTMVAIAPQEFHLSEDNEIADFNFELDGWRNNLMEIESADVVEVVRCNDCKHRIKWKESYGCSFWGYYGDEFADGEMFCSKGERRKERR